MDKDRRDNLREVIGRVRRRIEESLGSRLVSYGLFVDREPLTQTELTSLRPEQEDHYQRVLGAVRRHARAVGHGGEELSAPAVARFVRETGGTWVNRLAALRALEARGLLDPPAAFVGEEYGGLSPRAVRLRQQAAEQGRPPAPKEALRAGIEHACTELSESVRVLFDLSDEHSLVWPDGPTLRDVLRLLSTEVTPADWAQPDVLGWVYQYYNTEANAALKRLKNRTPNFKYRPDDIPIANQFYTPHWVVRVLADNTLGRLWLEMQDRLPRLVHQDGPNDGGGTAGGYGLVERRRDVPHARNEAEAFKAWLIEEPDPLRDGTVDRFCRFLVPLPSTVPPRAPKSVREIRVLDPACGSGHFLLYAFDVLFAMYREAEPDLDPRTIPALILEHNLFGIDIDLRAAQLAAFGLYLKARTTLAAIDDRARLDLRGLNIVVADAHINDDPRKPQYLDRFRDDLEIQELYSKVLDDLDHTNALGSLIKVRTEFETLFGRIHQSRAQARRTADAFDSSQGVLIETSAQLGLRETYRGHSGRTWTIRELLDELRRFEAEVVPSQDIGARLFYADLERTVGLLALLSEQYDVVLMNPPYGDMPRETRDYLKGSSRKGMPAHYPDTGLYYETAFIDQALDLVHAHGLVGALVPRSFMYLSSFAAMRTRLLLEQALPLILQEYGVGILDAATVRTVGCVVRKTSDAQEAGTAHTVFNRLTEHAIDRKLENFAESFPRFAHGGASPRDNWYITRIQSLADIPGMPYSYAASEALRLLFRRFPPLDASKGRRRGSLRGIDREFSVAHGISTTDDPQFVRFWWEVPRASSGPARRWLPFLKGGTDVSFYTRVDLVLNWEGNGVDIRHSFAGRRTGGWLSGSEFFGKPGVTWQYIAWRLRRFGAFGEGNAFGHGGRCIFPKDSRFAVSLTAVLNSSLMNALIVFQTPERKWEEGPISNLPIREEALRSSIVSSAGEVLWGLSKRRHIGDETCSDFTFPQLREFYGARHGSHVRQLDLEALLSESMVARRQAAQEEARHLLELDEEIYGIYEISTADRELIESELARRPAAEAGRASTPGDESATGGEPAPFDLQDSEANGGDENEESERDDGEEKTPEHLDESLQAGARGHTRDLVSRWLSYYVKETIENDEDGIVPVDAILGEPALIIRLRKLMERDLGVEHARALEEQAPAYLGTNDLAEWLATSREEGVRNAERSERLPVGFFPWHVALYRNCPIFWLLSSDNFAEGRTRLTFRVYLHYLKLTPDTLSRVVTHYLETTIGIAEREWRLVRDVAARSEDRARASAQRVASEWANTVEALQRFRGAVEAVIEGPEHAQQVPASARWLPRTIAYVRGGRDLGRGYQPDVDFGVRVNITPLVEQRLLPRVVLKRLGG